MHAPARSGTEPRRCPTVIRAARTGGDFVNSYARQLERVVAAIRGDGQPARRPGPTASRRLRIVEAAAAAAGAPQQLVGATLT